MSLFQRAHDILNAKANRALDAAEKPDEMLDLSYEQMLDQITKVRQALVTIAASRKRIELQEQQLQHSVDHLQEQAKTALSLGKEDLAREALSRKATAQAQINDMEAQHEQLAEQEEKLGETLQALQQRVNTFRTQKEVLKAQYAAASASASVNEDVAGISSTLGDSGAALQRAQDKIATMQARAGALDELLQSGVLEDVGGSTDDIQQELDEAGANADVDHELAALKAEIGPGSAPQELTGRSLFQRADDILNAKANRALDAAEKPDEMLDLSYEQMLDQITKVRQALVTIAASRKRIELQEQQLQHSVDHLQEQAKTALSLGKEDLAREALSRKATAQAQINDMEAQHEQLAEQEEKLGETLQALQQRVNTFRTQKEVLKAQYAAASASASVNEDVAGISSTLGDSGAALQRAQDKIATMQARAGALDELLSPAAPPGQGMPAGSRITGSRRASAPTTSEAGQAGRGRVPTRTSDRELIAAMKRRRSARAAAPQGAVTSGLGRSVQPGSRPCVWPPAQMRRCVTLCR